MDAPSNPKAPWLPLALIGLVPSVIAVAQLGRIHPDEVYQSLEPAFHRAHGYGVLAWEWQVGLRNWAVPILFSWLLELCSALGIDNPRWYRVVLELPQLALNLWALRSVFLYARRRLDRNASIAATALVGLNGLVLMFAGRTMSESFSAALLWIAVEALDRDATQATRGGLIAGIALGLSVVARYGSAVFVAAALGWLVAMRRWRLLIATVVSGTAIALLLGALDAATWGDAFHSLRAYLDFNVLSDAAANQFGRSPWWTYARPIAINTAIWAWIGIVHAVARQRPRVPAGLAMALAYVVAVTLTSHKEDRFLYPALTLLALTGAPGFIGWLTQLKSRAVARGLAVAALVGGAASLFWQEDLRGDQFRAIVAATRDESAHGLVIIGDGLWGVGGYFYIGKNIPWVTVDFSNDPRFQMAMRDGRVNRVVSFEDHEHAVLEQFGFREISRIGRETIFAR